MKSKKTLFIVLAVVALVLIAVVGWGVSSYNGLVSTREEVTAAQANVEVYMQRRADLVPNLVNTVQAYADHEEEVFTARAALSGANTVDELNAANGALDSALSRLLVVVENYPELKSNENFLNLQDELAGSENRIAQARNKYNEMARDYNTRIQRFPTSIIAGIGNFEASAYFEASAESQTVPQVNFD